MLTKVLLLTNDLEARHSTSCGRWYYSQDACKDVKLKTGDISTIKFNTSENIGEKVRDLSACTWTHTRV